MPENAQRRPLFFAKGPIAAESRPELAGNLLTLREACTLARISLRQYHRMRARGFGPKVTMLDGKLLVARSELEAWLRRHTETEPGKMPPAYR